MHAVPSVQPLGRRALLRRAAFWAASATTVVATSAGLSGCVIAPYGAGTYRSEGGPVADSAPPPAPYEAQPVSPGPAYVWIGGYWAWHLSRYVWVGGRWAMPPTGHAWVPGAWGRHGNQWRWSGGHWRRH